MRNDWIETELGNTCEIISGKNQKQVKNPKGRYPIYGSGGIFGYADEYLCEPGTTVIGRKGTINSPIYVNQRFWNVDTAFGISPSYKINSKYIYYFCVSFNFKKIDKSTTIPSLAKRDILKIKLFLPPFPEQRAIVAKIDQLFSDLDNGIANLKVAKAKLEIYRQAVLKKAFEGRFVANQNRKCLPDGWKLTKISNLCDVVRGGSPRPAGDERFYNGDIPFLKVADLTKNKGIFLTNHSFTIKEAGLKKTRFVDANTLLLSNSGATLGVPKICVFPTTFNDGIAAFLGLDEDILLYHYYFWNSKTRELRNINQGAAQPNLNTGIIGAIEIPIGPKKDLKTTVQAIETRLSVCDKLSETIDQSLEKSEALRQSILKKAFEGKLLSEAELQACRQEPDWEPAQKLLDRINEKETIKSPKQKSIKTSEKETVKPSGKRKA